MTENQLRYFRVLDMWKKKVTYYEAPICDWTMFEIKYTLNLATYLTLITNYILAQICTLLLSLKA